MTLQKRFEKNQDERKSRKQFVPDIDHYFIAALQAGLPDCAGVAVSLDRLLMQFMQFMQFMQTKNIHDVITFPIQRA